MGSYLDVLGEAFKDNKNNIGLFSYNCSRYYKDNGEGSTPFTDPIVIKIGQRKPINLHSFQNSPIFKVIDTNSENSKLFLSRSDKKSPSSVVQGTYVDYNTPLLLLPISQEPSLPYWFLAVSYDIENQKWYNRETMIEMINQMFQNKEIKFFYSIDINSSNMYLTRKRNICLQYK